MNGQEFADLCGISGPMVSKYAAKGCIARGAGGEILPLDSLELLDGHLDDDKRIAALRKLTGEADEAPKNATGRLPLAVAGDQTRRQLDEIKLDTARMTLARESGTLIPIDEAESAAWSAIGKLKEGFDTARRGMVEKMQRELGLSPSTTALVTRLLKEFEAKGLNAFADSMEALADSASLPPQAAVAAE